MKTPFLLFAVLFLVYQVQGHCSVEDTAADIRVPEFDEYFVDDAIVHEMDEDFVDDEIVHDMDEDFVDDEIEFEEMAAAPKPPIGKILCHGIRGHCWPKGLKCPGGHKELTPNDCKPQKLLKCCPIWKVVYG